MPKFFMQDYNLLAHPEGEGVWWMPGGMVKKGGIEVEENEGIDLQGQTAPEEANLQNQKKVRTHSIFTYTRGYCMTL